MGEQLLINVLKSPKVVGDFTPVQWDLLMRQAKAANLLSNLHAVFNAEDLMSVIPDGPRLHLNGAGMELRRHAKAIRWELSVIWEALYNLSVPIVVLKGAAYLLADLPISKGRIFNDIDFLVPKSAIEDVEEHLDGWGWRSTHNNKYDQRYYRTWMHEIPPMKHVKRKTVLDVHHAILPLTARLHPDSSKLIDRATNKDGSDLYWLCDVDMVLHSATHLFHDGELENGLRDLVDINSLIKTFSNRDGFWDDLCNRAQELELVRPLFYGLRYAERVLGMEVPVEVASWMRDVSPSSALLTLMDALFLRALLPDHSSCKKTGTGLARWLLYVRSHYLRMPLMLLFPHLIRKAIIGTDTDSIPAEVRRFIEDNPRN